VPLKHAPFRKARRAWWDTQDINLYTGLDKLDANFALRAKYKIETLALFDIEIFISQPVPGLGIGIGRGIGEVSQSQQTSYDSDEFLKPARRSERTVEPVPLPSKLGTMWTVCRGSVHLGWRNYEPGIIHAVVL